MAARIAVSATIVAIACGLHILLNNMELKNRQSYFRQTGRAL